MAILSSIVIGTVAGGLATLVRRSVNFYLTSSMAVGILGALLGAAANFWLGAGGGRGLSLSGTVASGIGAVVMLFLWIVAQRLFFGEPAERAVSD